MLYRICWTNGSCATARGALVEREAAVSLLAELLSQHPRGSHWIEDENGARLPREGDSETPADYWKQFARPASESWPPHVADLRCIDRETSYEERVRLATRLWPGDARAGHRFGTKGRRVVMPRFGAGLRERLAAAPADEDPIVLGERVAAAAWALIHEFQDEGPDYGSVSRASIERLRALLPPEMP